MIQVFYTDGVILHKYFIIIIIIIIIINYYCYYYYYYYYYYYFIGSLSATWPRSLCKYLDSYPEYLISLRSTSKRILKNMLRVLGKVCTSTNHKAPNLANLNFKGSQSAHFNNSYIACIAHLSRVECVCALQRVLRCTL